MHSFGYGEILQRVEFTYLVHQLHSQRDWPTKYQSNLDYVHSQGYVHCQRFTICPWRRLKNLVYLNLSS